MGSYGTAMGAGSGEFGEGEFGELGEGEFGEGEFAEGEFGEFGETQEAPEQFLGGILGSLLGGEVASPLNEHEQVQLASELLEISSEGELEQFLGGLFKKVARGVGGFIKSPVGQALGGVLKNVAKKALPVVGGALGSFVAPGIGTAIGSKLGSLASGLFEVELEGIPQEQAEFEVARRFVNVAATAARNAALARPRYAVHPATVARAAVARAARTYAPGLYRNMMRYLRGARIAPGVAGPRPIRQPPVVPPRPTARVTYQPTYGVAGVEPVFPDVSDTDMGLPEDVFGPDGGAPPGVSQSGRWVRRGRKIIVVGV